MAYLNYAEELLVLQQPPSSSSESMICLYLSCAPVYFPKTLGLDENVRLFLCFCIRESAWSPWGTAEYFPGLTCKSEPGSPWTSCHALSGSCPGTVVFIWMETGWRKSTWMRLEKLVKCVSICSYYLFFNIYVYIYMCVCVGVCVCVSYLSTQYLLHFLWFWALLQHL